MAAQAPAQVNVAADPAVNGAAPAKKGAIDQKDVDQWKNRFNAALADPTKYTSPAPADARPWNAGTFECFNPIDTCLVTYFCPCVTFGKTHHRIQHNGNMDGYEPINTSCILVSALGYIGLSIVPLMMQRIELRNKYNLQGNLISDLGFTCCCGLCTLCQNDKEAEYREEEIAKSGGAQQYQNTESMSYPPKA